MSKHLGFTVLALLLISGGVLPALANHIPTDYPDLVPLRWMGPEPRPAYEAYIAERANLPFSAQPVALPESLSDLTGFSTSGDSEKIIVLVNADIHTAIQSELNRYIADITAQGYQVDLYEQSGGTAEDLRAFLQSNATGLDGCVLVGDIVAAWFEHGEAFPADLFFMDLDGDWTDADANGMYEEHSAGTGDEGPEIFIGRIDTSRMTHGDEIALLQSYFDKNHAFWEGNLEAPYFGLTYTEDDWAGGDQFRNDIRYAYPKWQAIYAPATDGRDYVEERIISPNYEFIQLSCHSYHLAHAFTRGGWVYSDEIVSTEPTALFYNLFCCSASLFTADDFLGGAYIFNDSTSSLLTIGSSKSGSMLYFDAFYKPLGQGKSFGRAFKEWFDFLAPYDDSDVGWFFGMMIAGDPLLMVRKELFTETSLYTAPGPGPSNAPLIQGFRSDGSWNGLTNFQAFSQGGYGANLVCGNLTDTPEDCVVTGMGPGQGLPARVRAFRDSGSPINGCDVLTYGTKDWGVNVTLGDIDGDLVEELITAPGPGSQFRPHVRAWKYENGYLNPLNQVSFIISNTLRWGANIAAGDIDGDTIDEIITGAGPGPNYGPHVRAFNYDGQTVSPINAAGFFAYSGGKYGVNVTSGMVSRWDRQDIITAPGRGPSYGAHIRGFHFKNNKIQTSWGIDFQAYNANLKYGATVSCSDINGWRDEIITGPGPGAYYGPYLRIWEWSTNGEVNNILSFYPFHGMGYRYGVKATGSLY